MTMFNIEFIRHVSGRDGPETIEIHNIVAPNLNEVICCAEISLGTIAFRVPPDGFRIRENGGPIVYDKNS